MKTSGVISLILALAALTGCDSYPRDIAGTGRQVTDTRRLRVGYGQMTADDRALADRYVSRVAAATGSRADAPRLASNEALFASLEKGDLDLVIAEVAADSPWLTDVAVIEPLVRRRTGDRELGLSPVARSGENRWVMTLEREVRDIVTGS